MAYLYASGNYILGEDSAGKIYAFAKSRCEYSENAESILLTHFTRQQRNQIAVPVAEVTTWDKDDIGTKYDDVDDLRTFLRDQTGNTFGSSNPLEYSERWAVFNPSTIRTWEKVTIPGSNSKRLIGVTVSIGGEFGSEEVGVREVGSSSVRTLEIVAGGSCYFTVKTNSSGEIEIFSDSISNNFYVESVLL